MFLTEYLTSVSGTSQTGPSMPSKRPDHNPFVGGSCATKAFEGGYPTPLPRTRPLKRRDKYLIHKTNEKKISVKLARPFPFDVTSYNYF